MHRRNIIEKIFPRAWLPLSAIVVFCLIFGFFVFYNPGPNIYVFPNNPKQGGTVFIRVKTDASEVTGNMGKERLVFYKNGSEWVSFLGVDADQEPGDYKIFADTSSAEHLSAQIKIGRADFSSAPVVAAPSSTQTGITAILAVNNIRKSDNPALKKVLNNFTSQPYFKGAFIDPVKKVERTGFSFGKFIGFAKDKIQHLGVDLRAAKDTEVYAINDGRVVATLDLLNYGKTVIVDHGLNIFSLYLHLDRFEVSGGDMVRRGQKIGLSGDSGYATAPHLHFSIRVGTSRVDPLAFIETSKKIDDNYFLADLTQAALNIFR